MATDKTHQHEILAIFTKLFEELGRLPTRDEFVEHSKITQKAVVSAFGSYTDLVNASGFAPKRIVKTYGERKYTSEIVKFDGIEKLHSKFEVEIKPYYNKFDKPKRDFALGVDISDSHSEYWDAFTWEVFFAYIEGEQPELIVLGGDILEFYQISSHNKNPARAYALQDEIDFVITNKLKRIRKLCPKAQIDYHMGNHEFRLFRYICGDAPALQSLRNLQFHKLLELDDLEINLVAKENFIFQTKQKQDKENYKIYYDKWMWTHGTDYGKFPASVELNQYVFSGASGHVHRHTFQSRTTVHGYHCWQTLPASCTKLVGVDFMPNMINWDKGFGRVYFHRKGVTQDVVHTTNGFASLEGKYFYEKEIIDAAMAGLR